MDDATTVGILAQEGFKHPSVLAAGNQLWKLYNDNKAVLSQAYTEWVLTSPHAAGPVEEAGVAFEIMKKHPQVSALLIKALGIIYPHVPEGQQAIAELQTAVNNAPA
jgi:hypothetical protein